MLFFNFPSLPFRRKIETLNSFFLVQVMLKSPVSLALNFIFSTKIPMQAATLGILFLDPTQGQPEPKTIHGKDLRDDGPLVGEIFTIFIPPHILSTLQQGLTMKVHR